MTLSQKKILLFVIVMLGIGGVAWIFLFEDRTPRTPFPAIGSYAENFSLTDLKDGRAISLAEFRHKKILLLNFWASWSRFSATEMPDMATLQTEFGNDLVILAVNRAEFENVAERFARDRGVYDAYPLLLDPDDAVFKQYGGFAMPTSFFIDKRGIIRSTSFGPLTLEEMRERTRAILNPKP